MSFIQVNFMDQKGVYRCGIGDQLDLRTKFFICSCRMDQKDSKPIFVDQVGCTYTFWWDHHLACSSNSSDLITIDSCMVRDDQSGHVYDFRPLKKLQKSLTTQDKDGNKYTLRICSALSKGICCID